MKGERMEINQIVLNESREGIVLASDDRHSYVDFGEFSTWIPNDFLIRKEDYERYNTAPSNSES